MSRAVTTAAVDQSIRVWAYDTNGDPITGEAYNSAGIAVSVVVRSAGRILSTTALTLVARSGAGVHTDSAFTEVSGGEYVVDLPDSYSATAERQVSVTLTSTAITGGFVLSETLAVGQHAELDTATSTKIDSILEDTGTTLPGLIDGIGGGSSLTGPYTRTVTVTDSDSSAAIQNAKVRLYRTGETGTSTTSISGVATFTVEAATWSYAITANGYTGVTGTIVVSANGDTAVELDAAIVTPPTDPALCAIEVLCLGADFAAESDINIDFRLAEIPSGDQNKTYPGAKVTVSSDVDGIARWEAPQGAVVEYKRGNTHSWQRVTLDSDSATNVTSVIGSP